jgi:hypothetical protein
VTPPPTCPACRGEIPPGSAYCPACGTPSPTVITDERVAGGRATPPADGAAAPTPERLARALGAKYEVRRLVGRGGFAEVYEVWDRDLDRRLACKVLHPEIAWTPGMLARFRQEARALARLHHPAILPIHFAGDGEGLVYYMMPFVAGESLADALRRHGPLSLAEALQIAQPVLEALAHAHAQGLVHRDIKPDNVMLEEQTGRALLLDFGVAKLLAPETTAGAAKTVTGFTVGTVQYMSPEQALGQPTLDGRSDLYAFGAMLFQMVTGSPPYDGDSSAEIVGKHLTDRVPVASERNAKIPLWLSDVIVRCLAKQPQDRFPTATAVLAALAAGDGSERDPLVGAVTLEREVRRSGAAQPRSRRRRWWGSLAGAVAALLVAAWLAREAGYVGSAVGFVENALVEPVELLRNGTPVDTLPAGATRRLAWRGVRPPLGWRLLRPGNPPIGEPIEGPLAEFPRVRGRPLARVTAVAGGQRYFAPLITNTTASAITVEVNPGTAAAVRCNCLVGPGEVRTHVGYYRLYENSSVAAYNGTHPYSGTHVDRQGFATEAALESGAVVLTF